MHIDRLIDFLKAKGSYVLILRGIPGSGKTFLAEKIRESVKDKSFDIVSVDKYFTREGKYCFDASRLNDAYDDMFNSFLDFLDGPEGLIVVDNLNIRSHEISPYVALASAYKVPYGIVTVHCDPEIACSRHGKKIQDSKIVDMHRELLAQDFPSRWHRFEIFNNHTLTGSVLISCGDRLSH